MHQAPFLFLVHFHWTLAMYLTRVTYLCVILYIPWIYWQPLCCVTLKCSVCRRLFSIFSSTISCCVLIHSFSRVDGSKLQTLTSHRSLTYSCHHNVNRLQMFKTTKKKTKKPQPSDIPLVFSHVSESAQHPLELSWKTVDLAVLEAHESEFEEPLL